MFLGFRKKILWAFERSAFGLTNRTILSFRMKFIWASERNLSEGHKNFVQNPKRIPFGSSIDLWMQGQEVRSVLSDTFWTSKWNPVGFIYEIMLGPPNGILLGFQTESIWHFERNSEKIRLEVQNNFIFNFSSKRFRSESQMVFVRIRLSEIRLETPENV